MDSLVDDVYIEKTLAPSPSFTSEEWYSGEYGNAEIRLSFRVQCVDNFYGSDCGTYCVATDSDIDGHYVCGSGGEKICSPADQWSDLGNNCLTRE